MDTLKKLMARVLPYPKEATLLEGPSLIFDSATAVRVADGEANCPAAVLAGNKICQQFHQCRSEKEVVIQLILSQAPAHIDNCSEAYRLTVQQSGVKIEGFGEAGLLYGAVTFCQVLRWEQVMCRLPALQITDWPDRKVRGLFIETRYGSNTMEKEDWLQMLDEALEKKLNTMHIGLYGCWTVQYDAKVSEYLYVPVPGYPQLSTPVTVKYYSPAKGKWIDKEQLPPIFRDDFFGELVRYGKQRGITVYPTWNSLGHNTLIPTKLPMLSAKEADGTPAMTGFCTSEERLYDFLFSVYDHIIDQYLLPSGVTSFCIGMDEVMDGVGYASKDIFKRRSPWCQCEKCRARGKRDIFVQHVLKQVRHLKQKGITTVSIYGDELRENHEGRCTVGCGEALMEVLKQEDLLENFQVLWWSYTDIRTKMAFSDLRPELGVKSVVMPISGYYHWEALTHPMRNILYMAELAHQDNAEGIEAYSSWDKSYDRAYDMVSELSWGFATAGGPEGVTQRYVMRNFPGREENAHEAIRLMELITQVRVKNFDPDSAVISNGYVMRTLLNYYDYSYVRSDKPYPRNFPGEALQKILEHREIYERMLLENGAMAERAMRLFESIQLVPQCNEKMAQRYAYECENYLCIARDWLALLRILDMCAAQEYEKIIPLARQRREARLTLMAHCEQVKERYICTGLTMRNHSIFMQMFTDIAQYVEASADPKLDILNPGEIMSQRFWWLR